MFINSSNYNLMVN